MAGITNRFLSAEILGTLILTTFGIGVSWASLNTKSVETEERVDSLAAHQEQMVDDVMEIKLAVEVMRNEQQHLRDSVDEIKEQRRELQKIRSLLEDLNE